MHRDFYHFNFVISGEVIIKFTDEQITVNGNQLFVVPPGALHRIESVNGYKQLGIDIALCEDERGLSKLIGGTGKWPSKTGITGMYNDFDGIAALMRNPTIANRLELLNIAEKLILDSAKSTLSVGGKFRTVIGEIFSRYNPFELDLKEICHLSSYSKTQLERMANKEFGCGISAYINNMRINEICRLLQYSEKTMSEIAEQTGLYDASHLNTFFKRYMGTTPGKFRRNMRTFANK